ncbi:MAG: hypothetical protein V4864_06520 [Pseudomonadota bacterium]
MKPYWIPTLAWLAAIVVALLLAFAGPESLGMGSWLFGTESSHGAWAPR